MEKKLASISGGKSYSKYFHRYTKPRQEISRILKYLIFFINFIFVLGGITCTSLGIYIYANEFRPVLEAVDFFLNPSILLIAGGVVVCAIALLGCLGSLRENVCMLKMFAMCLFFCYITLVVIAFMIFILFYSDTSTGISIHSLLLSAVRKYHKNDNYRDFMDYLQVQLKCCGATSQGYKDWAKNAQYNCSAGNQLPERCGVPYSCCVRPQDFRSTSGGPEPTGISDFASGFAARPRTVIVASKSPSQCWRNAQRQSLIDVQNRVYTDGCLSPLQKAFEGHAVIIGAIVGAVIIPVCLSVTFSNIFARQIDKQKYLLEKEARREERRRRRARQKFRDPFAQIFTPPGARKRETPRYATVDETRETSEPRELQATQLAEEITPRKSRASREEARRKRRRSYDVEAQLRKTSAPVVVTRNDASPERRKKSKRRSTEKKRMRKSATEPILTTSTEGGYDNVATVPISSLEGDKINKSIIEGLVRVEGETSDGGESKKEASVS